MEAEHGSRASPRGTVKGLSLGPGIVRLPGRNEYEGRAAPGSLNRAATRLDRAKDGGSGMVQAVADWS
jgi:hypothetical protein